MADPLTPEEAKERIELLRLDARFSGRGLTDEQFARLCVLETKAQRWADEETLRGLARGIYADGK